MNADRLSRIDKVEFKSGGRIIYRKRMALQIGTNNIPLKPKVTRKSRRVPIVIDLTGDNPDLIITMTDDRQRKKDPVDYSSFPRIKKINSHPEYREVEATTEYSPSGDTYLSDTYQMPKQDAGDINISNVASNGSTSAIEVADSDDDNDDISYDYNSPDSDSNTIESESGDL